METVGEDFAGSSPSAILSDERIAFECVPAPLVLLQRATGVTLFANSAAKALAGGVFPAFIECEEFRRAANGLHLNGEEASLQLNGAKLPVLLSSKDMAGPMNAVIVVIQDNRPTVQARADLIKEKQKVDVAQRTKTWFLTNISHEIRTPLNAIMGYSELMSAGLKKDSEKHRYMESIRRNGEVLSRLVTDLLDLSKLEAQKVELQIEKIPPRQLALEVLELFRTRAAEKGIELGLKVTWPLPQAVEIDPLRVRQVLSNLIDNATKFTLRGSVELRIEWNAETGRLDFRVHDTGIGISQAHVPLLFQPFVQVDNSPTRRYGGSGLGLDISKKFAKTMGGDLRIEWSEPGKGSLFHFSVPAKSAGPIAEEPEAASPRPSARPKLQGARILVVEDAPDNRVLVGKFLNLAGAHVEFAVNGLEGVEKALKKPFDIILMDIQMPELDGYEATAHLRWKKYSGPIVALTAHALNEDRAKCFQVGFDEHLTKPVDRNLLVETMSRFLKREQPT